MARPVTSRLYSRLLSACLQDIKTDSSDWKWQMGRKRIGARDGALIAFAYTLGLKTGELRSIRPDDCDLKDETLILPDRRDASRTLPLIGHTRKLAALWETRRREAERFFYPMSNWGEKCGEEFSQRTLPELVRRRHGEAESLEKGYVTPQKLRAAFKAQLKGEGIKNAIIRDLMGLRSRRTAGRDDETADRKMEEALTTIERKTAPGESIPDPPEAAFR